MMYQRINKKHERNLLIFSRRAPYTDVASSSLYPKPYTRNPISGYSFVEVLVAISILLVAIVGPLTIASNGLQNARFAREQNTALFLAQEGIESIYYLRENAGLQRLENESYDTWDWTSNIPSACFSGTPCRVDVTTHTISECDPASQCDLYLHDSGTIRYQHSSSGVSTPFRRMLYFEDIGSDALRVRSVVEWSTSAFSTTRDVELETHIYDIYDQ